MKELIALFTFMTVPVWIPVIGTCSGMLMDLVRSRRGLDQEPTVVERLHARRAVEMAQSDMPQSRSGRHALVSETAPIAA